MASAPEPWFRTVKFLERTLTFLDVSERRVVSPSAAGVYAATVGGVGCDTDDIREHRGGNGVREVLQTG